MGKNTFTIHLAKSDTQAFENLLSAGARARLTQSSTKVFELPDFVDGGRLYIFEGDIREPQWFRDLRNAFNLRGRISASSACAILFMLTSERCFAVTFAHGWMYLDEANFEGDFGLRVALNTVDEKKLKRLERANLGDAMKGVSLSPFRREFRSFGVDDALDLVRKISGETKSESAADTLTGSRSLKYSGDCAIDDLPEIAAEVLESYSSESYKETSFGIIDVVTPVSDLRLKGRLDEILVHGLRAGSLEFELGLPDASDDESVAYRFSGPNLRGDILIYS